MSSQTSIIISFLREHAAAKGLSTYDIANLTGIDQAHVWLLLNGKYVPKLDTLLAIANAIGVQINLSTDDFSDVAKDELDDIPKKLYFTIGGRNFIYYSGKPRLIVEVLAFDDEASMLEASKSYSSLNPFLGSSTMWLDKYYLLIVIEFPDGHPGLYSQSDANRMARVMRRLADWYRYVVLAKAQN